MRRGLANLAVLAAIAAWGAPAVAQSALDWGRISVFGQVIRTKNVDGTTSAYNELSGSVSIHTPPRDLDGMEFSLDARGSEYPSVANRDPRWTVYDAWVGGRVANGKVAVRLGQMYLNDLGALGGVGGLALETRAGKIRMGVFGGLEPKGYDPGYVQDVKKGGAYVAYDGERGWRDVLGFVTIRNQNLAERNVLTTTNFIPIGREFFLYQAAEYDLTGPGGVGNGGLAYFFATARWAPVRAFEIQALYQHGRSIDARSITQDQIAGRPIDAKSLDGFLFDSMGGRATVEFARGWRAWAGYYQDKSNRDDVAQDRLQFGLSAMNVAGSGFDVFVSDNRTNRPGSNSYDAWYFSLGRSLGSKFYLTLDYSTSLSVLQLTDTGGLTIVNRPSSRRYSLSGIWNMSRSFSLLVTGEQLDDDTATQNRWLLGLTYRF
ncbi:MAG: hypothetical protein IPL89_15380 [Acidobacteria bacterium]|nr:hypothetical protein [Acidobacteriota bacterium]